jgi:hypothetical protein
MGHYLIAHVELNAPPDISAADMLVAISLANQGNDERNILYPSVGRLAERTRLARRTVQRCLRNLETIGMIETVRAATHNFPAVYRMPGFLYPTIGGIQKTRGDILTPLDVLGATSVRPRGDNYDVRGDIYDVEGRTDVARTEEEQKIEQKNVRDIVETTKQRPTTYPQDFLDFWKRYPSGHGNKKAAAAQWSRLDDESKVAAVAGLERWLVCDRWQNGYVKAAEIWLRDRWFDDEPPAKPNGNGKPKRATADDFLRLAREAHDRGRNGEDTGSRPSAIPALEAMGAGRVIDVDIVGDDGFRRVVR